MKTLNSNELQNVVGGESFAQVAKAVRALPDVAVSDTAAQTEQFIAAHPFFHQNILMNQSIPGGKHFRNVPFVGPGRIIKGIATGSRDEMRRGVEVTRGTWHAR